MSSLLAGVLQDVDRTIAAQLERLARDGFRASAILDIGCWDGSHTERYARTFGAQAHGIEIFPAPAALAEARGVRVARLDLETERFPWPDQSMDVVVSNQVFEHLKNVWTPMSEACRVLRPGGYLAISVPNLASLHNRVLLALGRQPTSIRTLGPHVRGYTLGELARFVSLGGAYTVEKKIGVGFYPFPASLARPFAAVWPGAAHTSVVLARKREGGPLAPWLEWFRREQAGGLQTFYEAASAPTAPASDGTVAGEPAARHAENARS